MTDGPDLAALLPPVEALDALPPKLLPGFVLGLAALQARAAARMTAEANDHQGNGADQLLSIADAAQRLAVTEDWLRRRPDLPFVVKLSEGVVRYSGRGIEAWISRRQGHRPA